jgi:two-component system alkaline phosphatase synthesis response regulator PhoP
LFRAMLITDEKERLAKLILELANRGLVCSINPENERIFEKSNGRAPDLVLMAFDGSPSSQKAMHLAQTIKRDSNLPVIVLLSREALLKLDPEVAVDDFVVEPWDANEIAIRAKRVLGKTGEAANQELIQCGDLTIDLARYEVYVNDRPIELTFKEYELLRFLARNKGRVFTREALLNEVWGYEYYGGDRTVDVHITRLRSKLEDPSHTFIETVRNIGYRFKESA